MRLPSSTDVLFILTDAGHRINDSNNQLSTYYSYVLQVHIYWILLALYARFLSLCQCVCVSLHFRASEHIVQCVAARNLFVCALLCMLKQFKHSSTQHPCSQTAICSTKQNEQHSEILLKVVYICSCYFFFFSIDSHLVLCMDAAAGCWMMVMIESVRAHTHRKNAWIGWQTELIQ